MSNFTEFLAGSALVAVGATLGTPARFFVSGVIARRFGETIPWGTLVVNVSGCLVMGLVGAIASLQGLSAGSAFWLLAATGFLGSYTTVSSFALQTRGLLRDGENRLALGYVTLSLLLCLGAVAAGFRLAIWSLTGHPQ
ncbi:CrcB protein [Enhydrobacter aerosaccus]|uniref:Fluoride-specific ion channel FluC n=1 Tax=Enhydrobacter aerosaccus TaxID=225324 RepID=A0A1T4K5F8_9HYPH|nr:fluoride efflux transporter CrcB [Enhydrobacter aerosaccus]SJZ37567.1 CrcB protein [Enhydrobacter aerosaccus]